MKMKLDKVTVLEFPTVRTWEAFFASWFDDLVDSLDNRFSRADREDAVVSAFVKLMAKPESEYEHVPETEHEWFGNVLWQAKSALSRQKVSRETWTRHHEQATRDGFLTLSRGSYCGIDEAVRAKAAFATLRTLCERAKMKESNVEAYVRWYLFGESSEKVAADCGTNPNNLYAIRHRIEKLLALEGRETFGRIRRRLFLEVA